MNCPKCGAAISRAWYGFSRRDDAQDYACGTIEISTGEFYESEQCLRNQLVNAIAERDAARAELERLTRPRIERTDDLGDC
jgi:hypothetical protein